MGVTETARTTVRVCGGLTTIAVAVIWLVTSPAALAQLPGGSAVDEYAESVPAAGGDHPSGGGGHSGSNNGGGQGSSGGQSSDAGSGSGTAPTQTPTTGVEELVWHRAVRGRWLLRRERSRKYRGPGKWRFQLESNRSRWLRGAHCGHESTRVVQERFWRRRNRHRTSDRAGPCSACDRRDRAVPTPLSGAAGRWRGAGSGLTRLRDCATAGSLKG